MERKATNFPARCPRCGDKNDGRDLVCSKCKCELMNLYEHAVDWETAYQIESELDAGKDIVIDF